MFMIFDTLFVKSSIQLWSSVTSKDKYGFRAANLFFRVPHK
jgi:hypothetical protein